MTREELGSGYYKLNIPKPFSNGGHSDRVAEIFKRAFEVPAEELLRSASIGESASTEAPRPEPTER